MSDKYTDDLGNEIVCSNCDVTARELFEQVLKDEPNEIWFAGNTWYCSSDCYDEATRSEG